MLLYPGFDMLSEPLRPSALSFLIHKMGTAILTLQESVHLLCAQHSARCWEHNNEMPDTAAV